MGNVWEFSKARLLGLTIAAKSFRDKEVPIVPAHIRMRPVSRGNWRCSLVGGATCGKTPFLGQLFNIYIHTHTFFLVFDI